MASKKHGKAQAGRLLSDNGSIQVYEVETSLGSMWGRQAPYFDQTTVAFSETHVAVRVSRGDQDETVHASQVVLSRDTFLTLLASYQAYERAGKRRPAPVSDDYDPFLDDENS